MRILRLLRVLKLKRLMYRFEEFFFDDKVNLIIEILKMLTFIFFIAHWIGCFFFAVSVMSESNLSWIRTMDLVDGDPLKV